MESGSGLQREIKVHDSQHGKRFEFNPYGTGYIGAFLEMMNRVKELLPDSRKGGTEQMNVLRI